ncbi:MAG: TonB-dependent receptor [Acidobacteriota bacterium]
MNQTISKIVTRMLLSIALLLFTHCFCLAQDTARVEGTITDSTGAALSGASVVAINTETNRRVEATANIDGVYVLPALRIGRYTIEFSAEGFRKVVRSDVVLTVNQVAHIDALLETGSVNEVIEVSSGAPLIESSTSSVGQVINEKQVIDLPINGRNFTQLATLIPGVSRGTPGSNADGSGGNAETFRQGDTGSAAISANGLREQNNNFQLDGIDNNESIVNTVIFFPPIEALQEFRVITSVAPAEFGRGGGAVITAVIKGGTNDYHGSLFELLRNSKFDARPTFSNVKPLFIRNQFGGTFGGPIKRDKTFFFFDYQGLRQRLPIEAGNLVTVPTARMRNGDFGELLDPKFTGLDKPILIYSPTTGQPYPGNIITDPLNPVAVNYLKQFPLPDLNQAQQNYFVRRLRRQTFNDGDVRVDHRFTDQDTAFVRFSIADDKQTDPGRIPGFQAGFGAGKNEVKAYSVAGNYTHTFTPTLLNELRIGYILQKIGFFPVGFGQDQNKMVGIPGIASVTTDNGLSLIGGGNGSFLEYLGDFGQFTLRERSLQFSDAITYIKGNHTAKFGASLIQRRVKSVQADFNKGFYFFSDFVATPGNIPAMGQTGYEVAEFLIGRTNFTTSSVPGINPAITTSYETGFFAQDDWRINQKLTLNVGLRYEVFTTPTEKNDRLANFDPTTGQIILAGKNGASRSTVDNDLNNFGPRIGLAYALNSKTVIRGGYGLFYSLDRGGIGNQLTQNPPFIITQFRFSGTGANVRLNEPIPLPDAINLNNPVLPPGSALRFMPKQTDNTRVQQFNITFEREFTNALAVSVAYVGTRGDDVTAVLTSGGFDGQLRNRLTTIANVGESDYNSLQIKSTLRTYKGLNFLASYTYGRANNNTPGPFPGPSSAFRNNASDPNNLTFDEGPADYDVRNRFTFAANYDLPFFSNTSGLTRTLLHGWQFNTIITLQDGTPFSVFGGVGRAALIGDPDVSNATSNRYFNTAAFRNSNNINEQSPRNFLRAPGTNTVDASVFKKFNINERTNFEFRAQAYNLFNRPQLGFPGQFVGAGDFGVIGNTKINSARQFEFGLRLTF